MKSVFNMNFIYQNIELFAVDFKEVRNLTPVRYEQLSPDCDIFSLHAPISNKYYAQYLEDIVESLVYVTKTVEAWWQSPITTYEKAGQSSNDIRFMNPDESDESFQYVAKNRNEDMLLLIEVTPPTFSSYHQASDSSEDGKSMIHYKQ
jgi:hypothetical protein